MVVNRKLLGTVAIGVLAVVILGEIVLTSLGSARSGVTNSYSPLAPAKEIDLAYDQGIEGGSSSIPTPRQVIRTASLHLLVESVDQVAPQIASLVTAKGGFVESSAIYESSVNAKAGQINVRVPSIELDVTVTEIKKLATKVERENVDAEDVTTQLVDLEARLRNLRATETQYLELMKRSGSISDIGNVVQYLSQTRGQIEQLESQIKHMSNQVAMSSIQISLESVSEGQIGGIVWRPFATAKRAFSNLLADLAAFADWLIAFLISLPIWILRLTVVALIAWIIWKIYLWLKPKFNGSSNIQ